MNNLRKRLLIAVAGGATGFFILLIADFIVLAVALGHFSVVCCSGPYTFSIWENLIVFGIVPLIIIFGVVVLARTLNINWWYGLLAGIIAVGIIVMCQVFGDSNYSPFNNRETLEYLSPVCVMVLISSMLMKDRLFFGRFAIFILVISFLGMKFIIPGDEFEVGNVSLKVGFAISLLGWIILPLATAFFMKLERKVSNDSSNVMSS